MSRESDLKKLLTDAHTASQSEQEWFAARLKTSAWTGTDHGEIEAWSASVAAVEAAGWQLAHWSVATDSAGTPSAYPIFRRRPVAQAGADRGSTDPTAFEQG